MLLLKKRESNGEGHIKLIAYTIILYVSSLFAPLVIVASYQSLVYYSKKQWFFTTPFSAYATFGIGMLFMAIVLTFYLIFRDRWNTAMVTRITWILLLLSIPMFYLSLTNYYYLDQKGIHYNDLFDLKEREYKWTNVEKLHIIYRNHAGTTSFYQYQFEMKDGSKISIPIDEKLLYNNQENKRRIETVIKKNKVHVIDHYSSPIVD